MIQIINPGPEDEQPLGWIVVTRDGVPKATGSRWKGTTAKLYALKRTAKAVAGEGDEVLPVYLSDCQFRADV